MRSWLPWRRPEARPRAAATSTDRQRSRVSDELGGDLARAARILAVRSRREATGLFAGSYASAFRGGGVEFDESRPYVPGDDVRNLDWNAMARTGEPFVKRFREERDEMVLLALDVSSSMHFGTTGPTKAATAAHASALLAAAAGGAGDRLGLLTFDDEIRARIPPARGAAHTWRVIETAVAAARDCEGGTSLAAAIEALLAEARHRSVAILLSDFRDGGSAQALSAGDIRDAAPHSVLELSRRHDLVSIVLHDPREEALPRAGLLRLEDPERPGRSLLLDSGSARARARYRRAWALRAAVLERSLRSIGSDVLWMRTDRDPLQTLMHFFRRRTAGSRSAA